MMVYNLDFQVVLSIWSIAQVRFTAKQMHAQAFEPINNSLVYMMQLILVLVLQKLLETVKLLETWCLFYREKHPL